jgi:adenosylhomocysteinase
LVTHLLADRPFLIEAIDHQTEILAIIPKPKSVHQKTRDWLSHKYNIVSPPTERLHEPEFVANLLCTPKAEPVLLLDIGGYFAPTLTEVARLCPGKILGIVEDTENGLQKYEEIKDLPCPIISVARSPLKNPEDYLVGQSIVFSVEALLRKQGDILHGRTACVIGYGKLGRSIANSLHARHVRTVVYDTDAIRTVEAMAHGFSTVQSVQDGVRGAGLVFCATGNTSLDATSFSQLDRGAYVATVTSSDDELALDDIREYEIKQVTDYITRYRKEDHHFYLLNRGQAVNFVHGAAVGPFIYLIQAEILASVARITNTVLSNQIQENEPTHRSCIAETWLRFLDKR